MKISEVKEEAHSIVQIDENNLDKECVRLASDYLRYALMAADAKRDAGELKAESDLVVAELSPSIRPDPASHRIEEVTEGAIDTAVKNSEKYQHAQQRLRAAQQRQEIAAAAVWAMDHKKRALTLM